jgi:hypothetical protein
MIVWRALSRAPSGVVHNCGSHPQLSRSCDLGEGEAHSAGRHGAQLRVGVVGSCTHHQSLREKRRRDSLSRVVEELLRNVRWSDAEGGSNARGGWCRKWVLAEAAARNVQVGLACRAFSAPSDKVQVGDSLVVARVGSDLRWSNFARKSYPSRTICLIPIQSFVRGDGGQEHDIQNHIDTIIRRASISTVMELGGRRRPLQANN